MAIKGKGKTRTKTVARGPRPAPVKVKAAFFLRRWVQVSLALAAGIGVMLLAIWVTNGLRQEHLDKSNTARDARVQKVAREWQTTVDAALGPVGQTPGQPPNMLPDLTAAIDSLSKGTPVKDPATTAKSAQTLADTAASDLVAVKLPDLIRGKGFDLATTNYMLNSQARMAEGLHLYSRAASLVALSASETDPKQQTALIAEAVQVSTLASTVYQEGYSDYQQVLGSTGIFTSQTGGLPGVPGGVPFPTG